MKLQVALDVATLDEALAPASSPGVAIDSIRDVQAAGATVAVAGGAIRGAADPGAAARELRAAIAPAAASRPGEALAANRGPHGVPRGPGPGEAG